MTDTDASMESLKSAARSLIIAVGSALVAYGVVSQNSVLIFTSVGPPIAAALWGLWEAWQKVQQKKVDQAKAVQSGINLVNSGQAVTTDGKPITGKNLGDPTTPPLPVTLASAAEIVKNFAPVIAAK